MSQARSLTLPVVAPDPAPANLGGRNTYLPHWGWMRRAIHRRCQRSRTFNTIVAALEMRLGREEALSLPQYMALCPTGQCNALCEFCSVTKARSGIIKKQLSFDKLTRFTRQLAGTVRMYGLEGNGEPTLYDQFGNLVESLTTDGATFYLITNGERLTADQIDLCLARGIESVNFSLNAATAETHRRVMKLKHFDRVVENIRRFVRNRTSCRPIVSTSFVVNRDNIHEVRDFLAFAEYDLCVDKILVRPLSELGNDSGVVEDVRDLVPYESEIKNMLESVREYLEQVPRRAEIVVEPGTFRSFRADPPERAGVGNRFLLPHPRRWEIVGKEVSAVWHGSRLELGWTGSPYLYLLKSFSIPCVPDQRHALPIDVRVESGVLGIGLLGSGGQKWAKIYSYGVGTHGTDLCIDTGDERELQVVLFSNSADALRASVDWRDHLDPLPTHQTLVLPAHKLLPTLAADCAPVEPRLSAAVKVKRAFQTATAVSFFLVLLPLLPVIVLWRRWTRKRHRATVRYYCQKPWTDLHNFSVDGRMDVCCIATGASQEQYGLGNLLTQDLQDVWNGPVMRQFRRTVNSDTPLPPCRRCPMAYAYQGPLFSPGETRDLLHGRVARLRIPWLVLMGKKLADSVMDHVLFPGFKK